MTVGQAFKLHKLHRASQQGGKPQRYGWRQQLPEIEEVRAEVLRKVAAMEKARVGVWTCGLDNRYELYTTVDRCRTANYRTHMFEVRQTARFTAWLGGLRDRQARARILKRVDRAAEGNLGDVAPVGDGVSEMRIHHGPGYRVYFKHEGNELIMLLCGGDKSTQQDDIEEAKGLAKDK
jgi:putative addiction module killer protein